IKRSNYYYLILIFTTSGYWLYSALPKLVTANNTHIELSAFLLPQALGMVFVAGILILLVDQNSQTGITVSICNLAVGCLFGFAAFAYLLSISVNGMVNAFLMSQSNIIIATILGVYVLKERQGTSKMKLWSSLLFIVLGAIIIMI
ncbi:GRP family sugar transporter, partial [Liquorilactobacillus ghanensis]